MRRFSFLMPVIALLAAGCQAEMPHATVTERTFVGTLADGNTRVSLERANDAYNVVWNEGDRVLVDNGSVQGTYRAVSGGTDVTDFKRILGAVPEGAVTAWYPETIAGGYPQVQEYRQDNCGLNPMRAVSDGNNLTFRNLGAILKLDLTSDSKDAYMVDITITADQSLSGPFTVVSDAAVVTGEKSVRMTCRGVEIGSEATSFFIAIPSGKYTNLVATFSLSGNRSQQVRLGDNGSYTFERSRLYQKSIDLNDLKKSTSPALFPDGKVFNAAVKSLAIPGAAYELADNNAIRKIVFESGYCGLDGVEIQPEGSGAPIYLDFEASSGTAYVRTPADQLNLPADASYMFADLGALAEISGLDKLNTSNCQDMSYMFCHSDTDTSMLRSLDLRNFNTAKCTTMRSMFNGLKSLESIDLRSFNTAKVTNFSYMFCHDGMLEEIDCSSFNTAKATSLAYMFGYCYKVRKVNVSTFSTANCTAINHLFSYCLDLQEMDISHFKTSKCTQMQDVFWHCHNIKTVNVKGLDTSKATDIRSFFNRCDALKSVDVSSFSGIQITSSEYCNYFFYNSMSLEEIIAGDSFMFGNTGGSSFFCQSSTSYASRPGSVSKGLTIICSQKVADWFATTNLRWINSGYSGKAKIPVTFKDYVSGDTLTVTWAAN